MAKEPARPATTLRVDSHLVLIPVSVCDPQNRPVTGLEKEHFKVFDDKVEQTVTHFSMDDEPVAVGLVFDISGSMGDKLRLSRLAASKFFDTANPDDEFFLVEFNDQPRIVVPLTHDFEEIQNQLTFAESKGRTALLDAIFLAMHEMKKSQKSRKALLIISDGGDNASRYTEAEIRNRVRESDLLIYAMGVYESAWFAGPLPGRGRRSGPSERAFGADRRPPLPRGRHGNARYRRQNRHRAAQPVRPRLYPHGPAARRALPSRADQAGPAARAADAQGPLANGILRAGRLTSSPRL